MAIERAREHSRARHSNRWAHRYEAALACLNQPVRGSLLDVGEPEMIRVATERLKSRADIRLGNAESLPWSDGSFDYVFCVDSFHHYPNPQQALGEFHRVLRPSGRLIMAEEASGVQICHTLSGQALCDY